MEKYTYNYAFLIFKLLVFLGESVIMFCAAWLAFQIGSNWSGTFPDYQIAWGLIFLFAWSSISALTGQYDTESLFDRRPMLIKLAYTFLFHTVIILFCLSLFSEELITSAGALTTYTCALVMIFTFRMLLSFVYNYRRLFFKDYKVVIIGSGTTANALYNFFTAKMTKVYRLWESVDEESLAKKSNQEEVAKQVRKIKEFCTHNEVKEIYCTLPITYKGIIEDISEFADNNYIRFKLANDFNLLNQKDIQVYFYDQTPIITLRKDPLSSWMNRLIKRAFDIIFSLLVLVLIFPPMLLFIGLGIKLSSSGPLFYLQKRSGRNNRTFNCIKFRTMVSNADDLSEKYVQATKGDPRITKIGAFLRKTSLDEFPQFINVFLGHMSVVGPRPHPLQLNDMYAKKIQNYFFRYYITPGITGMAQIQGYRGETTSDPDKMKKRVELDSWYIQNWSLFLDVKIILKTFASIFKGDDNAY
ncbi:MAG: undecaprenyl-phosphate glucose phosphotransferase [Bacteroidia bacterium]|nr:undecaprenyl-phosphate glucose phosphotransferase [Bacteroidia bacterium]